MDTLTKTREQAQPASATGVAEKQAQAERSPATGEKLKLEQRAQSGASWFFWIAALSVINSSLTLAGTDWGFIIGLGITQVFDAIGTEFGSARFMTFGLSLLAAGTFVFFGVMGHKRHSWAYIVGMVLYALDGLLFLMVGDILSVGFHVFVLIMMFNGYRANKTLVAQQR